MRTILSTSDASVAQLATERLAAAGIRTHVYSTDSAFAGTLSGGGFAVVVAVADAQRAEQLLRQAPTDSAMPAWLCAACGERCEAVFDACWNCGAERQTEAVQLAQPAGSAPPPPIDAAPGAALGVPTSSAGVERRGLVWLEVAVVLWVGWFVYFLSATIPLLEGNATPSLPPLLWWVGDLAASLGNCFVVALVVARGAGPLRHGLVRPRLLQDLGLAAIVFAMTFGVMHVFTLVMHGTGVIDRLDAWFEPVDSRDPDAPSLFVAPTPAMAFLQLLVGAVHWLVLAAGEEFVFRAYLLPRLLDLLGSRLASTLVSTALFASYHVYLGAWGVAYAFVFGLMMAAGFWCTGRVWPLVLAHALANALR